MKKTFFIFVLAAMPMAAQSWEIGAFVGQQTYDKFTAAGVETKPESKVVSAVRIGYAVVDFGPTLLQVNAGAQLKSSSEVKFNGNAIGVKLDHQATSLGLALIFKAGVSASVGIDYRWDKLEGSFLGVNSSTTYGRPWLRGNIGYAFPTPVVKPFVGLEVAGTLSSKTVSDFGPSTDEEALKGLAPKLQFGVYFGIRF